MNPKLPLTRRDVLRSASCGFGYLALAGLTAKQAVAAAKSSAHHPLAPRAPHFEGKAKRVIFLCMRGAPAHVDMFDYKPQTASKEHAGSVFQFNQAGKSGLWISDLFPEIAGVADELTVINSLYAETSNHTPATFQQNSGFRLNGFPVLGSWASYGLGCEADDLPITGVCISHLTLERPGRSRVTEPNPPGRLALDDGRTRGAANWCG